MITHVDSIEDAERIISELKETIEERDEEIRTHEDTIEGLKQDIKDLEENKEYLQEEIIDRDDTIGRDNAAFNNILDEAKGRL
jgi:chromosome segregation ATPase